MPDSLKTPSPPETAANAEQRYRALLEFLPYPVSVFALDSTVVYVNPAFTKVLKWTLPELAGKRIPFVPDFLLEETRQGMKRLFRDQVVHEVETQRYTKDGRLLDLIFDAAVFYEKPDEPAGLVAVFRDVSREKRIDRTNQALFRVAKALHRFQQLDGLLDYIAREVRQLLGVRGSAVILADAPNQELFFHTAAYDDTEAGRKFKTIRFPIDKGNAGHVYQTGRPLIVPDTSKSPFFLPEVDAKAGYQTYNMLHVPISTQERKIGVLCAVNKARGDFDDDDVDLLSTIASTVALPIENARINEQLKSSYEAVKELNRAKDRVIHHLSHELKTPVSVLSASFDLLNHRLAGQTDPVLDRILQRAQRNLQRILEMQYEIEDILHGRRYPSHRLLSGMVTACRDELAALAEAAAEERGAILETISRRIDDIFGLQDPPLEHIRLDRFAAGWLDHLKPLFAHRNVELLTDLQPTPNVRIPSDVLQKIITGLVRNAVEHTPDRSRITVSTRSGPDAVELAVHDDGIGITPENQRLIFESNFTTHETMQYSSRRAFDFNAGGKGFDLLRMKIFSERYGFRIDMSSERCGFIPCDSDICPGDVFLCTHCREFADCRRSGGTTMRVTFPAPLSAEPHGKDSDESQN